MQIVLNVALRLHLRAIGMWRLANTAFARARDEGGFRSDTSYTEQLEFGERLRALGPFDLSGYGPRTQEFDDGLERARY
jgi:hypothetical protein